MVKVNPVTYQGPNQTYKPPLGDYSSEPSVGGSIQAGQGYFNLDRLKSLLGEIIDVATTVYTQCEAILSRYSLKIDDTALRNAHDSAYPNDTTPDYISFDEYKYLYTNNYSNASQFVIAAYEKSIRGPGGCNALDISKVTVYINSEAKRIKEFIDGYIGDLDDTSEQRTVELFQDWAQDARNYIKRLWAALQGQSAQRLPQSELDQLTAEEATRFQAIFHIKLNVINTNIDDLIGQMDKNWEKPSQSFYSQYLGPALQFQLNVGREVRGTYSVKDLPVLGNEAVGSMANLDTHFTGILADQIKRNKMFVNLITQVLVNMGQRDTYLNYMAQLAQVGTSIKSNFVDTSRIEQIDAIYESEHPLDIINPTIDYDSNFIPSHSFLSGLDADDAHPQYLLRSGGEITGDISVAAGVKVGGIVLGEHAHTGADGSSKISGSSIAYDTITVANVDTANADTSKPTNLVVANQVPLVNGSGITNVTVQIAFEMDANAAAYEFEITEI